ncbi:hypothetical protein C8R14_13921, partial [Nitrosomonas eutropha]
KRYYYDSHDQLKAHLHRFVMAYNFAKRLKALKGLTPYEYICKIWKNEPDRFIFDPFQHTVGLNSLDADGYILSGLLNTLSCAWQSEFDPRHNFEHNRCANA